MLLPILSFFLTLSSVSTESDTHSPGTMGKGRKPTATPSAATGKNIVWDASKQARRIGDYRNSGSLPSWSDAEKDAVAGFRKGKGKSKSKPTVS